MKVDTGPIALAIICGCLVLGSCVFTSSQIIKSGFESVASSLDRVARSIK